MQLRRRTALRGEASGGCRAAGGGAGLVVMLRSKSVAKVPKVRFIEQFGAVV